MYLTVLKLLLKHLTVPTYLDHMKRSRYENASYTETPSENLWGAVT